MRKLFAIYAALAAFSLFCASAHAQEMWQGTKYGMSVNEVRAQVPAAVLATEESLLANGSAGKLVVPEFELVNEKFKVTFYFKDTKLTQVMLSLKEPRSYAAAMRVFNQLTEALRARYGKELSMASTDMGIMKTSKAEWLSGKTNIGTICTVVSDAPAILNLYYQMRIASEASKL